MNNNSFVTLALMLIALSAWGQEAPTERTLLFQKKAGPAALATMAVDTAPGTVSALAMVGLAGDQISPIENPGDLTLALKALDRSNNFGLSITPARTSLLPLSVRAYNESRWARVWANTTFSFAQGTVSVEDKDYRQRAFSIETSYFVEAEKDDPLIIHWKSIDATATEGVPDDSNPCLNFTVQLPAGEPPAARAAVPAEAAASGPRVPAAAKESEVQVSNQRAAECRRMALAKARWNASRVWASWASGSYRAALGGQGSHSLGRTLVLGGTYGIGDLGARMPAAITIAFKRSSGEPVLSTFGAASPTLRDVSLVTLRGSMGSPKLRVLLEASNTHKDLPTASERTYKRAIGLDAKLAEGWWLNLRFGKQRRIDNQGDEVGSSLSVSYSPKALLNF